MESRKRSASETHFEYYLGIESDCIKASRFVEFTNNHRDVHSHYFSQILTTASAEFESVSKAAAVSSRQNEPHSIANIHQVYGRIRKCMRSCELRTRKGDLVLRPFSSWQQDDSPRCWKAYNKIKHSRHLNATEGSMVNALLSLGALYFANLVLMSTEQWPGIRAYNCCPTELFSLSPFPNEPK